MTISIYSNKVLIASKQITSDSINYFTAKSIMELYQKEFGLDIRHYVLSDFVDYLGESQYNLPLVDPDENFGINISSEDLIKFRSNKLNELLNVV